jgi:peptidoglycan/xylan/chitin deacetylase (PgdA/CDA1 family)
MIDPESHSFQFNRREALREVGATAALAVASGAGGLSGAASAATTTINESDRNAAGFWPNGARLAVSFSLMFEGGGQPISGAGGVIPDPIEKGVPDLPTNAFFAYGHYEGIPRVLDLMDKHGIKLSSFMIGKAVETSPDIAQEIVRRGHEAAAHGRVWNNSYQLSRAEEKRFIADSVETIHKVTGQTPVGWNAYWMRNSIYILETLQDLGFLYHIDEPSHDEPFIVPVRGLDFVTVPYSFHMNDIVSLSLRGLESGRLRAGAARRIRSTLRGGSAAAAHDGGEPTRPHLRPRRQGASPRPLSDLRADEARRVVWAKGRNRALGSLQSKCNAGCETWSADGHWAARFSGLTFAWSCGRARGAMDARQDRREDTSILRNRRNEYR